MPESFDDDYFLQLGFSTSLNRARRGHPSGGREVLELFARCVTEGREVPREVLEYLAAAFRSFLADGERLDEALNVRQGRGGARRQAVPGLERGFRDTFWASEVHRLVEEEGFKREDAIGDVADRFGVEDSTVRRAVKPKPRPR